MLSVPLNMAAGMWYRCYTNEKVVVEQKIVRSLRRCAPQRQIAELNFLLRLTPYLLQVLCSTSSRFSSRFLWYIGGQA
jgi:hypothetical protein